MQITPQVHIVDGITPPLSGWKFLRREVHRTSTKFHHARYSQYNAALIIEDKGLTLIEAGTPESFPRFTACIEGLGFKLTDLKTIIIGHYATDHIGELKRLVAESGAKVYAHELEIPLLQKQMPPEFYTRDFEVAHIDYPLKDGTILPILGGLEVIHTPGHTPGSCALYLQKQKMLFGVDMIRYSRGEFHLAPPQYIRDYSTQLKSMLKLATYDFDILIPYHGMPLIGKAGEQYREFIEYLKAISDIFLPSIRESLSPEIEGG